MQEIKCLKPQELVKELDKYIIGQTEAKKAVAVALRNRYRRKLIEKPLRDEIVPKNILMIGSTGVGKTEIARRIAKLTDAPFVKVEATNFTEVGYVGKDVDSIIKDLTDVSIKKERKKAKEENEAKAKEIAKNKIIDIMLEILPEESIEAGAYIVGTGSSQYPNQINNVLVFPGLFRGLIDAKATTVTLGMMKAASLAIANCVKEDKLAKDYILPYAYDKEAHKAVAKAVKEEAILEGFIRK